MFTNKNLTVQTTFKNKNLKALKMQYSLKKIKTLLLKNSYTLIFFYDFLSLEQQYLLKVLLTTENLKSMQVKKNLINAEISSTTYNFLPNLLKNNTLLITPQQSGDLLNSKLLQKFKQLTNLHFLGFFSGQIFYRPSELKKFSISKKEHTKNLLQLLKFNQKKLVKCLTLKK